VTVWQHICCISCLCFSTDSWQSNGYNLCSSRQISAYHHWSWEFESRSGEVYLIQHYVIKFVS